jgi:hypothetical protein
LKRNYARVPSRRNGKMIRPRGLFLRFAIQVAAVMTILFAVTVAGVFAGTPQTINFTTLPPLSAIFDDTFGFAATSVQSPSNQISFSGGGSCDITDNLDGTGSATMTSGTGNCTVIAQAPGDSTLNPALKTKIVNAQKKAQTITVTTPAPATKVFNPAPGTDFTVDATSDSGLEVAIRTLGMCTGGPGTNAIDVEMTSGTGACSTTFSQAGDANYLPATPITQKTTAQKAAQTITPCGAPCAPVTAAYNSTFVTTATASSGLPVTITNTGVCTRTGTTTRMTSGAGVCTTKYNQPGNVNYLAAPQVLETTNATKANQTINVLTHAPANATFNTTFSVNAIATSGLAVTNNVAGVCTKTGSMIIKMTSGTGACTVTYSQAGNGNYNAATNVIETTTAQKANQTIGFGGITSKKLSLHFLILSASATSGLTVTFASTTPGVCTVSGQVVTFVTTGLCTITANQAGNANFNAATQAIRSFSIIP